MRRRCTRLVPAAGDRVCPSRYFDPLYDRGDSARGRRGSNAPEHDGARRRGTQASLLNPLGGARELLAREKRFDRFLQGPFFEHLVTRIIREAAPGYDIETGVQLRRADAMRLELDIIAVGRYRPYIFSCMTGNKGVTAKHKAFEVLTRTRQVGGLTARPGLITALDSKSNPSTQEVESITTVDDNDPAAHVRVLGIDDVLELATATPSAARRALGFDD